MQQRITHGTTIDVATPAEVGALIAAALDRQSDTHYRREKQSIQLNASGNGTMIFKTTRLWDWILERVTITCGTGTAGIITFYENETNASDMLEVIGIGTAGQYSDSFDNRLFVPAGSQLLVVFASCGNNAQASCNLQVRLNRALA